MSVEKNITSVLLLLLLAVGAFCTVMLIFKKTKVIEALEYENYYKIAGSVINSLLSLIIGYLTISSNIDAGYKFLVVIILFAGLITELYLTIGFTDMVPDYAVYVVITFNFLFRTYMVIQNVQESWTLLPFQSETSSPMVRQLEKAVAPGTLEKVQDNEADAFINKFRQLGRQAREKVGQPNFDDKEYTKALNEIIKPAAAAGKYSDDLVKEAAKYLKDKTGNVIEVVFGGGRRRKR